jgi:hypothetical protein
MPTFSELGYSAGDVVQCLDSGDFHAYTVGDFYTVIQGVYELVIDCGASGRYNGTSGTWERIFSSTLDEARQPTQPEPNPYEGNYTYLTLNPTTTDIVESQPIPDSWLISRSLPTRRRGTWQTVDELYAYVEPEEPVVKEPEPQMFYKVTAKEAYKKYRPGEIIISKRYPRPDRDTIQNLYWYGTYKNNDYDTDSWEVRYTGESYFVVEKVTVQQTFAVTGFAEPVTMDEMVNQMFDNRSFSNYVATAVLFKRPRDHHESNRRRDDHTLTHVDVMSRVVRFKPRVNTVDPSNIAIWRNDKAKDFIFMKPGRAIKHMFPELSDAVIEQVVDAFRQDFPVYEYTLHTSQEAADFKKAYMGAQPSFENIYCTSTRKSSANSCMRYDFNSLGHHPVEAYASGDFTIYWTETADKKIGSRCVVLTHKDGAELERPVAGPLYGTTEQSLDVIGAELLKKNAYMAFESNWEGARLKVIPYGKGIIAPYIDDEARRGKVQGDYITLAKRGDYDHCFDNYSGVFGARSPEDNDYYTCIHCEDEIDEGDEYSTDDGYMCESCFRDSHRFCAWANCDVQHNDEGAEATFISRLWHNRGDTVTGWVNQGALDGYFVYVEEADHWYHTDLVTNDTYDQEYRAISWMEENKWFTCEGNQQWYPPDQLGCIAGDPDTYYSQEWLEGACYVKNELGTWELKEEEEIINVEEAA